MKRRNYIANITDTTNPDQYKELAFTTKYAWNSAIRATEDLMRDYARKNERVFNGDKPRVIGGMESPDRQYMRTWTAANGQIVTASVWEVR